MKIAQKLGLLVGALLAAVLVTIVVLSAQLANTSREYQDLIDGNIQQREASRTMLVEFGQQVTALQQILLSARDAEDYDRLKGIYDDLVDRVHASNADLLANVGEEDPRLRTMLQQFETSHDAVNTQYRAALDAFVASDFRQSEQVATSVEGLETFPGSLVSIIADYRTRSADELIKSQNDSTDTRLNQIYIAGVLVVLIATAAAYLMVRGITRPVRALTDAALNVANERLPQAVAEIGQMPADASPPTLPKFAVTTRDELATLASALNTLQDSAVDLALEQRRNEQANAETLVNLGRRNQSLMTRMLGYVTELERDESNPNALDKLFRLDHLTTRIRRNAESLLVLAGAKQTRTWSHPIAMQDVLRASLSEIEEYNRVTVHHMDHAKVSGSVAADLTHMLAELLENATRFSPRERQVQVVGRLIPGGYQFDVIDAGLGMNEEDLNEANDRISQAGSRRPDAKVLGLHVVGRIAARRDMVVRLLPSDQVGLTAQVLVPASVISDAKLPATFHDVTEVPMLTSTPSPAPAAASAAPASLAPTPRRNPTAAGTRSPSQGMPAMPSLPAAPAGPASYPEQPAGVVAPFPAAASAGSAPAPGMPPMNPAGAPSRRVRGAQLGDLAPGQPEPQQRPVDPNVVRSQMSSLQSGQAAARRAPAAPTGPLAMPELPSRPSMPAPMPSPSASPMMPAGQPNPNQGPVRRVRGAQLGDLGPASADQAAQPLDPNRVRSQMSSLQSGVAAARRGPASGPADAAPPQPAQYQQQPQYQQQFEQHAPQAQPQNPAGTPVRRVRGAQLAEIETDHGGAFRGLPRDAQGIGRQLSSLQAATTRATQETGRIHGTDEEDTMENYS
ncbi:HAMP domain-containing protein [Kineosporia rhizophila]|uniref:HAMP domain-containing sensor histidine kinase n=1 Tax=Kineosporia rhizophila TaxID=84633 RepID=UPI001E469764|nr:ATP-binding protein [Kineosporia rhizophila]MCE0539827.1 HAMP domain-containing protein [Kineosporia rhizophila]